MNLKIGELAERAECQVVTVRYYEKEGLLKKPPRSEGGYRLYGEDDVERLKFIRHCRHHGMALDEVKELLQYRDAPDSDCAGVSELVDRHIDDVEAKIKSLNLLKKQLIRLRGKCPRNGAVAACGIMQGLDNPALCGCAPEAE
ncbi:Cd(II)/Pb(II)-responsive transcriptional regulator [Deltaproteobacteria bacterium Smac51]|nr:Cd(II)/Pb(II)-responsive transcriptional regulator [Deltaproteobacteria bacterium Smac51]